MSKRELFVALGVGTGGLIVAGGVWSVAPALGVVLLGCLVVLMTLLLGVDVK